MERPLRRRSDLERGGEPALRALVVDDDENYQAFIRMMLQRLGFEVVAAFDGGGAMTQLEAGVFDLIVIDFEMPRVSGLQVITELREHRNGADAYALMLTARDDLETKIVALRLGFDDFITKSTTGEEMVAKLGAARRLIQRQRRLDAAVRELYGLATRDELTGLFNRRYFFTEAERLLAEGSAVHLVFFDLDAFKVVNDTYGHLAGDRILRDIGALFILRTRPEDMFARYGGDEFVLLVHTATLDEVELLASRLADEVRALTWNVAGSDVRVGVTTGLASSALFERPTVSQLLNAGDRDLYKNKWIRANPTVDPAEYRHPSGRADGSSDMLESGVFPPRPRA